MHLSISIMVYLSFVPPTVLLYSPYTIHPTVYCMSVRLTYYLPYVLLNHIIIREFYLYLSNDFLIPCILLTSSFFTQSILLIPSVQCKVYISPDLCKLGFHICTPQLQASCTFCTKFFLIHQIFQCTSIFLCI